MPILADIYYHLYEGGEVLSPPVVLIHGIGGTHSDWPLEIRRLRGYRMYAIDLPGHGKSRSHGYQSAEGYANSILEWLDAAGIYRAVFVGYSLGSLVAINLGCFHPNRVAGLGLIANEERNFIPGYVLDDIANSSTYQKGLQYLVSQYFHPNTNGAHSKDVLKWLQANRPSVVYGDLIACNNFDLNAKLASIQSPTLILHGEGDCLAPLRRSQYLANIIPNAQLSIVPQAGHMAILEQPQLIAHALLSFLKNIPYTPGQG